MLLIITLLGIEAFSIFDGQHWPDELQLYGVEHLVTLADHFTPTIVDLEKLKCEWEMLRTLHVNLYH